MTIYEVDNSDNHLFFPLFGPTFKYYQKSDQIVRVKNAFTGYCDIMHDSWKKCVWEKANLNEESDEEDLVNDQEDDDEGEFDDENTEDAEKGPPRLPPPEDAMEVLQTAETLLQLGFGNDLPSLPLPESNIEEWQTEEELQVTEENVVGV